MVIFEITRTSAPFSSFSRWFSIRRFWEDWEMECFGTNVMGRTLPWVAALDPQSFSPYSGVRSHRKKQVKWILPPKDCVAGQMAKRSAFSRLVSSSFRAMSATLNQHVEGSWESLHQLFEIFLNHLLHVAGVHIPTALSRIEPCSWGLFQLGGSKNSKIDEWTKITK